MNISQSLLKSLIHYDPDTGVFTWRERPESMFETRRHCNIWNARYCGKIAGTLGNRGYSIISIRISEQMRASAHRLAFLYCYGYIPSESSDIDHINGDKTDNRIVNLRECSRTENNRNTHKGKNNKSGFTGVRWCYSRRKWTAEIGLDYKNKWLGGHVSKFAAVAARQRAEKEYGFTERHGK